METCWLRTLHNPNWANSLGEEGSKLTKPCMLTNEVKRQNLNGCLLLWPWQYFMDIKSQHLPILFPYFIKWTKPIFKGVSVFALQIIVSLIMFSIKNFVFSSWISYFVTKAARYKLLMATKSTYLKLNKQSKFIFF